MAFSLLRMPASKIHEETVVCGAASALYSKLKSPSYGCCSEISELGFPIEVATGFAARVCDRPIRQAGIFDHNRLVSNTERQDSATDVVHRPRAAPNSTYCSSKPFEARLAPKLLRE